MKLFLILTLLLLQGVAPALCSETPTKPPQQKMHALVLCLQESVTSFRTDSTVMQHAIREYAKKANMKLSLTVLKDSDVSLRNIKKWAAQFNACRAGSNQALPTDVIFVYYTGKRTDIEDRAKTEWPVVEIEGGYLDREEVETIISNPGYARFVLVMFESSSSIIHLPNPTRYIHFIDAPSIGCDPSSINSLFTKSHGSLFIASSAKNKPSFSLASEKEAIGFLTRIFVGTLGISPASAFWRTLICNMYPYDRHYIIEQGIPGMYNMKKEKELKQEFYIDFSGLSNPDYQKVR